MASEYDPSEMQIFIIFVKDRFDKFRENLNFLQNISQGFKVTVNSVLINILLEQF